MKYILNKKISKVKQLLLTTMLMVYTFIAFGQDSKGKEFWICFPGNEGSPSPELYITSEMASTVTIDIPGLAFNQVVNVVAGGLQVVVLPTSVQVQSEFVTDNKGIHITANNEVTVYGMNAQPQTTDAFLAFPLDAIGNEYYVMAFTRDFSFSLPTQATFVATQNNTTITITSSLTSGGFTAGVPANIVLQQGEVYQMRSLISNADYTGTKVVADKPIGVFGGARCTNISGTFRACDHLVEQMPPLTSWGKSFVTVPLATRLAGDVFRFLAQKDATSVSVNGVVVASLNAGQFFETILSSTSYNRVTANEPILVGQYSRSSQVDNVVSDPFFALVPPDEQFLNFYTVSAGTATIPNNFVNITSTTANTGNVKVDGGVVAAGLWNSIAGTSFSGAKVPISTGVHTIGSTLPIGILVYGFGSFDSYGYVGGQSFSPVATVSSLAFAPKTSSGNLASSKCFTATVKDQFGAPVAGVRVDFGITGPNSALSGFSNTDANGIAQFCYTGVAVGTDDIKATVGSVNDNGSCTWVNNSCNIGLSSCTSNPCCNGWSNGSIDLKVAGALLPITYLWSNGATSEDLKNIKAGTYTVEVTDANNCKAKLTVNVTQPSAICATTTISPNPTVVGHQMATIYLGYGPQCVTISAKAWGGTGTLSYDWGSLGTTASISVCPKITTIYSCTIKDRKGCKKIIKVQINVVDVRCGPNSDMVLICRKVNCNTRQTVCVSKCSVPSYLVAGAKLGACPLATPTPNARVANSAISANTINEVSDNIKMMEVKVFPNPASSYIDVKWSIATKQQNVMLNIFDMRGRMVMSMQVGDINYRRVNISGLQNGVYLLQVIGSEKNRLLSKFIVNK